MSSSQLASEDLAEVADRLFRRLRIIGPLCPSQLSVDTGVGLKTIYDALKQLEERGVAERTNLEAPNAVECPWRIRYRRRKFGRRERDSAS